MIFAGIVIVIIRIIYVNSGVLPYPGIKIVDNEIGINKEKYNIKYSHAQIFSKSQWEEYLAKENIEKETEFFEKNKAYDVYKNPYIESDNCEIVEVDFNIKNNSKEKLDINLYTDIILNNNYSSNGILCDLYYTSKLNGIEDIKSTISISPEDTLDVKIVFVSENALINISVDYIEFGNNQRMIIDTDTGKHN